jgi:hypothetical protein
MDRKLWERNPVQVEILFAITPKITAEGTKKSSGTGGPEQSLPNLRSSNSSLA